MDEIGISSLFHTTRASFLEKNPATRKQCSEVDQNGDANTGNLLEFIGIL